MLLFLIRLDSPDLLEKKLAVKSMVRKALKSVFQLYGFFLDDNLLTW